MTVISTNERMVLKVFSKQYILLSNRSDFETLQNCMRESPLLILVFV